jgi:Inositol hexakisphosphate
MNQVLWFNMREEPFVYINGLPFVLREQQRPMKNLQVGCQEARSMLLYDVVGASTCLGTCLSAFLPFLT